MRPIRMLLAAALALTGLLPVQAEPVPYDTTIVLPEVAVRAGPSPKFYVTSKLVKGERVRVLALRGGEVAPLQDDAVRPAEAASQRVRRLAKGRAAADGTLHPMQAAFRACHGLQCGFCTPGMVMSAVDLVQNHTCGSDAEIRAGLEGNICRCTGYQNIVKAVQQGAKAMA